MNILGWAAALLALTLSCSKTPDIQDPEAGLPPFPKAAHEIDRVPLTRAEETFVQAGNQFAWKLTKKVWDEGEKKSLIISPLSVQYALGMLGNGADAAMAAQIADVLGYEGTDAILVSDEKQRMKKTEWLLCPNCNNKTRIKICDNKCKMHTQRHQGRGQCLS